MEDLSIAAPEGTTLYPLGGGNPAHIQEVQDAIRDSAAALIGDANRFASMIGDYDAPQGHEVFRACLANQLSSLFGAKISAEHIAITNGSQAVSKFYSMPLQADLATEIGSRSPFP